MKRYVQYIMYGHHTFKKSNSQLSGAFPKHLTALDHSSAELTSPDTTLTEDWTDGNKANSTSQYELCDYMYPQKPRPGIHRDLSSMKYLSRWFSRHDCRFVSSVLNLKKSDSSSRWRYGRVVLRKDNSRCMLGAGFGWWFLVILAGRGGLGRTCWGRNGWGGFECKRKHHFLEPAAVENIYKHFGV